MITIGFTGTQKGVTKAQEKSLMWFIMRAKHGERVFRHGDCIGADEDLHDLLMLAGLDIIKHPPINPVKRAFCFGGLELEPKEYIERTT